MPSVSNKILVSICVKQMTDELSIFLDTMAAERGLAANTLKAYERDITQFLSEEKINPQNIKIEHISHFIRHLSEQSRAVRTINRKLSAIRDFCKFLLQEKILKDNPLPDIITPKKERPLPKFLTSETLEILFQTAKNQNYIGYQRAAVILRLIYVTGLRVSEALSLNLTDISHEKKQIFVKGKGNKERIVFFDDQTNKLLFDYFQNIRPFLLKDKKNPFVFPSQSAKDGHLTRDSFFKTLKKLSSLSGISPSLICPHALRHSFATNLINHDVSLRSVQKMLGHENISTTEIYTHIASSKIIHDVFEKHPLKNLSK